MQQSSQACQQLDGLCAVPVILVPASQHIPDRGVGGHRTFAVEATGIADDPHELAVILSPDPMTRHGGVLACSLAQQFAQRVQPGFGDRSLPGAGAAALGELVEDAPGLGHGSLVTLADQQNVHAATRAAVSLATVLRLSMMKSSDSLRVSASMH